MKKLQSLYLIASDEGYRLVHTHDLDLAEISLAGTDEGSGHGHGVAVTDSNGPEGKLEQERNQLAKSAIETLQKVWAKGTYDRIIIAASPKTLGHLRAALPKSLHAHVAAELHKDLLKIPVHELAAHFKEVTEA